MDEKEDKKIVKDRGKVKILKDPSRTRLCFCLHTGNCGVNRTYCTQRLAGVVLTCQYFLLDV